MERGELREQRRQRNGESACALAVRWRWSRVVAGVLSPPTNLAGGTNFAAQLHHSTSPTTEQLDARRSPQGGRWLGLHGEALSVSQCSALLGGCPLDLR